MNRSYYFIRMFAIISLMVPSGALLAQSDLALNKKYFTSLEFIGLFKNNSVQDSFNYGINCWHLDGGILWRRNKVLMPFFGVGASLNRHFIAPRYFDSLSLTMSATEVTSVAIHPKVGFELRPGEFWFLRFTLSSPMILDYCAQNIAVAERFGIIANNEFRIHKRDMQMSIEVGRLFWRSRISAQARIAGGLRPTFAFPTPDASTLYGVGLGLRYHFDR